MLNKFLKKFDYFVNIGLKYFFSLTFYLNKK
jgi:hypothetical protein